MAMIFNGSIDVTKIDKTKLIKGAKGTYLNITFVVNDQEDNYGNRASIAISQSKEEREAKQPKVYLGNAKLSWSSEGDKPATTVNKSDSFGSTQQASPGDDLPF